MNSTDNKPVEKGLQIELNPQDNMQVPCPTCGRVGRVATVLSEQTADSEVCKSCGGWGWITVNKIEYLKNRV